MSEQASEERVVQSPTKPNIIYVEGLNDRLDGWMERRTAGWMDERRNCQNGWLDKERIVKTKKGWKSSREDKKRGTE